MESQTEEVERGKVDKHVPSLAYLRSKLCSLTKNKESRYAFVSGSNQRSKEETTKEIMYVWSRTNKDLSDWLNIPPKRDRSLKEGKKKDGNRGKAKGSIFR